MLNIINVKKFIVILNIFFFIFIQSSFANTNSNSNCTATNYKNFNHENYKKVKSINIEVNNKKKWFENALNAISYRTGDADAINKRFKERFKAKIIVYFENNEACVFKGSIRLHGDFKDHLKFENGNFVSSLDVIIKNGHINSIRKFKLYLPDSRSGVMEILTTELYKALDILAPNTFFVNSIINDQRFTYLFQEKISKEMIEKNLKREGPIFEGIDDSIRLSNIFTRIYLTKLVNNEWILKNSKNFTYTVENFNRINRSFMANHNYYNRRFYFEHAYLKQNLDKFKIFEPIMYAGGYPHGISKNNRFFFLNIVSGEFEPIYYDGVFYKIKNFKYDKNFNRSDTITRFIKENSNFALKKLREIDTKKFYESNKDKFLGLKEKDIINFFSELEYNLIFQSEYTFNDKVEVSKELKQNLFSKINSKERLVFLLKDQNRILVCDKFLSNCKLENIDQEFLYKLISGVAYKDSSVYYLIAKFEKELSEINISDLNERFNEILNKSDELNLNSIDRFRIITNDYVKTNIDYDQKIINFVQTSPKGRIFFEGEEIKNWSINFSGVKDKDKSFLISSLGNKLLTGCITFYDLQIKNINFKIKDTICEDGLNLINSSGMIDRIEIENSLSDALDIDFSSIEIDQLSVNNALNDCADFSGGNYDVKKINLNNCGDKAISVGEKSLFKVAGGIIKNSNYGIVSKDSSITKIDNINLDFVETCIAAYNKKSEFSGGSVTFNDYKCLNYKEKEEKDEFSKIENISN